MNRTLSRKKSAQRVFHCGYCNHHLRLGARACGACYKPTPLYNRKGVLAFGGLVLALLLAGIAFSVLMGH